MGKTLRQFGLWALIWRNCRGHGMGGYSRTARTIRTRNERGNVVLEKQRDGHFHATVVINGAPIDIGGHRCHINGVDTMMPQRGFDMTVYSFQVRHAPQTALPQLPHSIDRGPWPV